MILGLSLAGAVAVWLGLLWITRAGSYVGTPPIEAEIAIRRGARDLRQLTVPFGLVGVAAREASESFRALAKAFSGEAEVMGERLRLVARAATEAEAAALVALGQSLRAGVAEAMLDRDDLWT